MKYIKNIVKKISIHNLIVMSYCIFCGLIILIINIFIYYFTSNIIISLINDNLQSNINAVNSQIDIIIKQNLSISETLCNDDQLKASIRNFQDADTLDQLDIEKSLNEMFENYWMNRQEIHNISIILAGKKYASSVNNAIIPLNEVQDSEWFKKINNISGILLTSGTPDTKSTRNETDNNLITILSRIYDGKGSTIGILRIDLSKNYIYSKILENNKKTGKLKIFFVDNSGSIIIDDGTAIENYVRNSDIKTAVRNSQSSYLKSADKLLFFSSSNNQGWKTIGITNAQSLYAVINKLRFAIIFLFVISLIIAFSCASLIAGIITRPITRLVGYMCNFHRNDKKVTEYIDYQNEIGTLFLSYNCMLDRISSLIEDVNHSNKLQHELEIKTLQVQINPHFLYNTLDSISWSAIKQNVPQISEALSNLSMLYRLNQYRGTDFCTLQDEILQVKLYMDLQKQCFNSVFDYQVNIPAEIDSLYIPRFILQPLIENSIVHGFTGMSANGSIYINAEKNENLVISILDNGKGMSYKLMDDLNCQKYKSDRYGTFNVIERIKLICGEAYGIKYSQVSPFGTRADITLPIMESIDFHNTEG